MYIKIQQQNAQYLSNIEQLTEQRTLLLDKLAKTPSEPVLVHLE